MDAAALLAAAAASRVPGALHGQIQLHERRLEKHQERVVLVLLVEDERQEENGVVCARASRLDATSSRFDAARATVAAVHLQPAARQVEREDDAEGAGDEREDHRRDDVGCRVDEVEVPRSRRLF